MATDWQPANAIPGTDWQGPRSALSKLHSKVSSFNDEQSRRKRHNVRLTASQQERVDQERQDLVGYGQGVLSSLQSQQRPGRRGTEQTQPRNPLQPVLDRYDRIAELARKANPTMYGADGNYTGGISAPTTTSPSSVLQQGYQATQDAFGNNPYMQAPGMAGGGFALTEDGMMRKAAAAAQRPSRLPKDGMWDPAHMRRLYEQQMGRDSTISQMDDVNAAAGARRGVRNGMADGGSVLAKLKGGKFDARHGGPVPEGPPGVDTVPSRMTGGDVMLDAPSDGPQEYVVPGDVAAQFPNVISVLEQLRQKYHDPEAVEMRRAIDGEGGKGLADGSESMYEKGVMPRPGELERAFGPERIRRAVYGEGGKGSADGTPMRGTVESIDDQLRRLRSSRVEQRVMDRNISELPQMRAEAAEMSAAADDMAIGLAGPKERSRLLAASDAEEARRSLMPQQRSGWSFLPPPDERTGILGALTDAGQRSNDVMSAPFRQDSISGGLGAAYRQVADGYSHLLGAGARAAGSVFDDAKQAGAQAVAGATAQTQKAGPDEGRQTVLDYAEQQRAAGTTGPGVDLTGPPSATVPRYRDGRTASTNSVGPAKAPSLDMAARRERQAGIRAKKNAEIDAQDRQDSLQSGDPGTSFLSNNWENSPEGLAQYRRQVQAAGGRMLDDGRVELTRDQPVSAAGLGDYVRRAGGREAMGGMTAEQVNDPGYIASLRKSAQNAEPTEAEAEAAMQRNINAARSRGALSVFDAYKRGGSRIEAPDGATVIARGGSGLPTSDQPLPPGALAAMQEIERINAPKETPWEQKKFVAEQNMELIKTQADLDKAMIAAETAMLNKNADLAQESEAQAFTAANNALKAMIGTEPSPSLTAKFYSLYSVARRLNSNLAPRDAIALAGQFAQQGLTQQEAEAEVASTTRFKQGTPQFTAAVADLMAERGPAAIEAALRQALGT